MVTTADALDTITLTIAQGYAPTVAQLAALRILASARLNNAHALTVLDGCIATQCACYGIALSTLIECQLAMHNAALALTTTNAVDMSV